MSPKDQISPINAVDEQRSPAERGASNEQRQPRELKQAHVRSCRSCPHRVIRPALWAWPHCDHDGRDAELDDDFMAGPDSNCSDGRWGRPVPEQGPTVVLPEALHVPWCLFGSKASCCEGKFVCRRAYDRVRLTTGSQCGPQCPDRVGRLSLSAVITARNEGEEVRRTFESLAASALPDTQLEILIVDDGSTDDACRELAMAARCRVHTMPPNRDLRVVRHRKNLGVGRSRNDGWRHARGGVLVFLDAHMRFPQKGSLETLALRALRHDPLTAPAAAGREAGKGTVVCAGSRGLTEGSCRLFGCDLFWNPRDGLQAKWRHVGEAPPQAWLRSPCPMGACYVMTRRTAERLEGATGELWDDTAGLWGFSEQAMALKAFLLGVPVEFSRDVVVQHLYRATNPLGGVTATEKWKNVTWCTARLLGRQVFDGRFRSWCERRLGPSAVKAIAERAFALPQLEGSRPPEEAFTHLCGKGATADELHPDHQWFDGVIQACERLATSEGPVRVLQWRPGEATALVRRLLPDAQIDCIEAPGPRADAWRDWCRIHDVHLAFAAFGPDYAAAKGRRCENYDLVLVGGAMQEACAQKGRALRAVRGALLRDESAGRGQLAGEDARKEQELLTASEAPIGDITKQTGRPQPGGPSVGAQQTAEDEDDDEDERRPRRSGADVTVILLNWRRPGNLPRILDCLAGQTVPVRVAIWSNGDPLPAAVREHPLADLVVESGRNLGCMTRWHLAALAETEFVCCLDDDLMPADERVIENAVAACREGCPDGIVGAFGWRGLGHSRYRNGEHLRACGRDEAVDVVKGRFMLMRRRLLERVPLTLPQIGGREPLDFRCDDVALSLCTARGEPGCHLLPAVLAGRWVELPKGDASLDAQPAHYAIRDRAIRALSEWLVTSDPVPAGAP